MMLSWLRDVRLPALLLAFATATFAACAPSEPADNTSDGSWAGTITTEGNVTTVRNESGSVWVGPVELVEKASIGAEGNDREYLFGQVRALTSDGERIFVADSQAALVRVYDWNGMFQFDLGGRGQGPGEFREPKGIGIASDGRILVQDDRLRRINVFAFDGTFLESWDRQWLSSFYDGRFTVTPDGDVFIYEARDVETTPGEREFGMRRFGQEGGTDEMMLVPQFEPAPDSFVRLEIEGRTRAVAPVPFMAQGIWMMGPDKTMVSGFADRYRFEIRHPDGSRIVIERTVDPAPVDSDEFEWVKEIITTSFKQRLPSWAWDGPGAPETKPFFERLFLGRDGRVFVLREEAGQREPDCAPNPAALEERMTRPCWTRVYSFDVFESEGRLLTTAPAPDGFRPDVWPWIRGDDVVLAAVDELGEMVVKRYRLVLPGEE